MSETRLISRRRLLHKCDAWPTMQWVPQEVLDELDAMVGSLRLAGEIAYRKDVLGLLILSRAPTTTAALRRVVARYQRHSAPALKGRREGKSLMVTLPSPVSLRLDALVDLVRDSGDRCFRHDVVGALILYRQPSDRALVQLLRDYHGATAEHCAVPGTPLRRVLLGNTPAQGRRPRVL
jgi:hypothetical protein